MFTLPWKLWIDEDGQPTQRATPVLLGGQGDTIPMERAIELGLIGRDGQPKEPTRGKPTGKKKEGADDGQ